MSEKRKLMQFFFLTEGGISTHYHQNLELFYTLNGVLRVTIDDVEYEMKKGDIILVNANKRHMMEGNEDVLGARFEIDFHQLAELMGSMHLLFWCNTIADKNTAYAQLRKVLDQILSRYFEKDSLGALHLNSLYYEALHILTSNFLVKADDARLHLEDSPERMRIQQIQNYIQTNYQSEISLNDLADRLYLSNAYLSKYVKKHFGLTFMEYLNNVRLFHAVDELLYSDKNITRVALDNGFPTSAAFTKAFRNMYHESPSEYRKRVKEKISPGKSWLDLTEDEEERIQKYLHLREAKEEKQPQYTEALEVDVQEVDHILSDAFKAVCIGEASLILQSEVQKQLQELQRETGIKYARIWNLFSKDMNFEEGRGWNFQRIDRVLDFLLENHMKPYLEMGVKQTVFMYSPDKVLKESIKEDIFYVEGYEKIVKTLIAHLLNRYGVEEIETWYFECWHHPRISIKEGIYYDYFETLYRTLKSVSEKIKVGGAGFILGYETLEYHTIFPVWKKRKILPDFLSFYSYQYIAIMEDGQWYGRKSIDSDYMKNQMEILKEYLSANDFQVPKLHISEWNFTISNRNVLNDSCEQGAYVLKNCIDMEGSVDFMAYWHALDMYSDYYDVNQILHGDSGMISSDGIRKPAFYAYVFLNRLLPNVLKKDRHFIVTGDGRDNYAIACHNFKKLSSQYVFWEESEIQIEELDHYVEDTEALQLTISLKNVKIGQYTIKSHFVNQESGSVQDIWKRLRYGKDLLKDEMNYLKSAAIPRMEIKTTEVTDGKLKLDIGLQNQEIRLVEIQYLYTI